MYTLVLELWKKNKGQTISKFCLHFVYIFLCFFAYGEGIWKVRLRNQKFSLNRVNVLTFYFAAKYTNLSEIKEENHVLLILFYLF